MSKAKIISIINQKGGVGKTTISFNLAWGLALKNNKVLILDNDPQGNLTSAFLDDPSTVKANVISFYQGNGKTVKPHTLHKNLDLVGTDIHLARITEKNNFDMFYKLKEALEPFNKKYDYIIIDCLPSLGVLNIAALMASTHVLIPSTASHFALSGLTDLLEVITNTKKRANPDLKVVGILMNMVGGRATNIAQEIENLLRKRYKELVFSTVIHKGVKMEESPAFNQSIMEYEPNNKLAKEFKKFINEFLRRIENDK